MKRKSGFTIVEMLTVIAILAILMGIVTVGVGGAIKNGRKNRAKAMASALQVAVSSYYSREGKWPGGLETIAKGNSFTNEVHQLDSGQVDTTLREVLVKSAKSSTAPYVDVSSLFVAASPTAKTGLDYAEAIKPATKHRKHLSPEQMSVGYADRDSGRFRQFIILYNVKADAVTVLVQPADE